MGEMMANDRIWIFCLTCHEKKLITKHFPGFDLGELWEGGEGLVEWISEHLSHHPLSGTKAMHLNRNPGLVITTDIYPSGELTEEIVKQISVAARDDTESAEAQE